MEELQQHQGEWFFLHELNVDKVFSTIQRADYLILYYIKVEQEAHPGEKIYLADLAAAMGLRVTELSKGIEKLQDSGFVTWKTDREAGRTYVELSSKAVELMAEEQALLQRCYRRMRAELGDAELRRAAAIMQRATAILKEEREYSLRQWLRHSWKRGLGSFPQAGLRRWADGTFCCSRCRCTPAARCWRTMGRWGSAGCPAQSARCPR